MNKLGLVALLLSLVAACGRPTNPSLPQLEAATPSTAVIGQTFDTADLSHDGMLIFPEWLQLPMTAPAGGFAAGEREKLARRAFDQLDINHDGILSRDEAKPHFGA